MKSIRGAIAVVENTDECIVNASKSLINSIMDVNNLKEEDVVFALFTVTNDLNAAFPAKAFRELGMMSIPALDAKTPDIQNDLDGCIRILVTVNNDIKDIQHSGSLW
jgi:monofunctional chorismate mutase